jgi:tetratricopeptide (TPR) repeat protein
VRSRRPLFAAVAASIAFVTGTARADSLRELEKAHGAYVAHKYEDAEARLRALLDPRTGQLKDPDSIADARMYLGAVLFEEGRREEANEVFEKLVGDNAGYRPDALRVSLDAIDAFFDARTRLQDRICRNRAKELEDELAEQRRKYEQRIKQLERPAGEERIVDHNSRWRALLPFGVGQFENGQSDLGWVFVSTQALLATGSAVLAVVSIYEQGQERDAVAIRDWATAVQYRNNAWRAAIVSDALAGGFLFAAVVGAIHAELTFVPERVRVRARPLPPVSLFPILGPGTIGITGRF